MFGTSASRRLSPQALHRGLLGVVLAALTGFGVDAAVRGTTLVDAAKVGDAAAVRALLKQGRRPDTASEDGTTALHWATYREDVALVELLISAGADVNAANRYGATPLALACRNGNATI